MDSVFTKKELERYSRHILIPEFNIEGQKRLKESRVLVVGAGGLGSPLLLYLSAAGINKIGIVDFDVVEESNLQRQVLFTVDDIGKSKAQTAATRLKQLNPYIRFEVYETQLTSKNALEIIEEYDIVADGTDNFPTRYLVNDACVILKKAYVYASIFRYEGQVAVLNHPAGGKGRPPNYRDIFPEPPPPGQVPSCAEGGVLGVLPGIIGSIQANEVIKIASGVGEPLSGKLFLLDAFSLESRTVKITLDPDQGPIEELIDYVHFCGLEPNLNGVKIKEISVQELYQMKANGDDYQLIDVRDPHEYQFTNIEGILIPMAEISNRVEEIAKDKKVILHCRSGFRSAKAIVYLERTFGLDNLYNLKGGILAWAKEIDSSIPKY